MLTPSQSAAADIICNRIADGAKLVSLAGPAGTGKTTMIAALLGRLPSPVVVTPTNKAAAVLRQKGIDDAATIYARFFTPYEDGPGRVRFTPNDERPEDSLPEGKISFAQTIVVDEASMLPTWLLSHLKRMSNRVILVGDPYQLPPVGDQQNPGGFFCQRKHDAVLTEVLRQGSESPILSLASHIREGRFPDKLVRSLEPSEAFARWYDGSQKIIAFTNAHRRLINTWCRTRLGFKSVLPAPGDLMICNTNLSDHLYNGTEFSVESFTWDRKSPIAGATIVTEAGHRDTIVIDMVAMLSDLPPDTAPPGLIEKLEQARRVAAAQGSPMEGASVSYAYCITAHKAQGSEWPRVAVVDERFVLGRVDQTGDTTRRWLYTAITRAKESLLFSDFRWFKAAA